MVQNVIREQVKVPAQFNYLRVLRNFVVRIGKKYGFSSGELYAFKASVDEACSNIIEHGYNHKDGSITIKAIVKNECLVIELVDQGKSFDPKQVKRPNLKKYIDTRKKGGLGVFIMRKLLDDIDYRATKDCNILRLIKFRQPLHQRDENTPIFSIFRRVRKYFSITNSRRSGIQRQ